MAQVKLSALVADIKGRLGGSIFQGGSSGLVLRNASYKGVNRSIASEKTRANLVYISSLWGTLTPAQRNQWSTMATTVFTTNKFGDSVQMTGQRLFIQRNSNLWACELPLTLSPVPILDAVPYFPVSMIVNAGGQIIITTSTVDPLWYMVLSSKRQYRTGGLGSPGGFKQWWCIQITGAGTFPVDFFYSQKWGPTIQSTGLLYKYKLVNAASGYATPWSFGSAQVV